jgi:hypothetical protein
MIMPLIIMLSLSCGALLLITVIQLLDMWILDHGSWILDLLLPHYSNICLALVLPLSSLSSSHVCYLWLIVMSIFLHFCHLSTLTLLIVVSFVSVASNKVTSSFLPFPLYSKGDTTIGKHGGCLLPGTH